MWTNFALFVKGVLLMEYSAIEEEKKKCDLPLFLFEHIFSLLRLSTYFLV